MKQTNYQTSRNSRLKLFIFITILITGMVFPLGFRINTITTPGDNTISNGALALIIGYFSWNIFRSIVKSKANHTLPEVKAALKEIQFIATNKEIKKLKSIHDPDEFELFIRDFWKKRDPTPQTAVNEFKIRHQARIKYCNDNFSTGLKDGASTDMGRVYILYGEPFNIFRDEIDTSSNAFTKFSPNVYPVEIWVYNFPSITSELPTIFSNTDYGGTVFVFMDLQKIGEYTQVYSNKPNEYIDNRVYR